MHTIQNIEKLRYFTIWNDVGNCVNLDNLYVIMDTRDKEMRVKYRTRRTPDGTT